MELGSGNSWFSSDSIASFSAANEGGIIYECREDVVSVNFLQLVR